MTEGYVIDASVAIKWIVDEAGSDAAFTLRGADLAAPALLRIETANVLRTLCARSAVGRDDAEALFALLQSAPVVVVDPDEMLERRALTLALALAHPVYDCLYLALAEGMGRTLVTADRRFLRALHDTPHAGLAVPLERLDP